MKITKIQKAFLKNIENDKARETQKIQFKLQNNFDRRCVEVIFTNGEFKTDNPAIIEFLNLTPLFCKNSDETLTKETLRDITEPKVVKTAQVEQSKETTKEDPFVEEKIYQQHKYMDREEYVKIEELNNINLFLKQYGFETKIDYEWFIKYKCKIKKLNDIGSDYWFIEYHTGKDVLSFNIDYSDPISKSDEKISIVRIFNYIFKENINLKEILLTPYECIKPTETGKPKTYSLDDMENCFNASRLDHPVERLRPKFLYNNFKHFFKDTFKI